MRAIPAVLLVAAALIAAVHAGGGDANVLDGTANSLSIGSETTSTSTTVPTATTSDHSSTTTSLASSSDEETTKAPQAAASSSASLSSSSSESTSPATVAPSDASPTSNSGSGSSPSATTSAPTPTSTSGSSSSSSSSTSSDHVGALTDVTSTISNATSGGLSTSGFIGIAFGALACVGAIVLIVTYKKKGDRDSENQQRPPSSCAYADGNAFTPDTRSLDAILDLERPQSSDNQQEPNEKLLPVLSMADLTSSSATRASSPFGLNSKAVRVSSPARQFSSNCSDDDMVFATSSRRQHDGSDVVLTFADMERTSSASTVAAIEDGRGQVLL